MKNRINDINYFHEIIDVLVKKYNVDEEHVFVVGWSNGGHMAYRLACEMSGRIAGMTSFAGYMALKDFSN